MFRIPFFPPKNRVNPDFRVFRLDFPLKNGSIRKSVSSKCPYPPHPYQIHYPPHHYVQGSSAEAYLTSLARKKKGKTAGKTFWLENSSVLYNGRIIRANYSPSLDRLSNGDKARPYTISSDSWVGLTLIYDVPPTCPAAQPLLPTSHQPKQNQRNSHNQSQPDPTIRADGTPCRNLSLFPLTSKFKILFSGNYLVRSKNSFKSLLFQIIRLESAAPRKAPSGSA